MRYLILICSCLFLFNSCIDRPPNVQVSSGHTLIDFTRKTGKFYEFDSCWPYGFYPAFYIGKVRDTYNLGFDRIYPWRFPHQKESAIAADSSNVYAFADTGITTTYKESYYNFDLGRKTDSVAYFNAFPVFIFNQSDSFIWLGQITTFIREAFINYKWVPIEKRLQGFCGFNAKYVIIGPHEVCIVKALKYKGNLFAKCRLRYTDYSRKHIFYSNTFYDFIDKNILRSKLEPDTGLIPIHLYNCKHQIQF